MGIKILFTISSKSLTTRQKSLRERDTHTHTHKERKRQREREREREREYKRGPLSAAQDQN
jgi:hypothetical protein